MLRVSNINVFIEKKRIIQNTSLSIQEGNITGLIGPNGAGKTTIMKTILGLTKFTGKIEIGGKNVSETDHKALENVGALIEHPAIYPFLTGYQNLKLYSHDIKDMEQIVSRLKMNDYIYNKSKGYSLGMKQKLGIAIALLNNPKLIILDEPMNGLDIESTILIRNIIKDYAEQGTSFLISSHILSELQKVMTNVILINKGKLIIDEPINEFYKLSERSFKISVENNNLCQELLTKHKIDFSNKDEGFIISCNNLYRVQDILYEKGIHFNELSPIGQTFEELVFQVLDTPKGAEK